MSRFHIIAAMSSNRGIGLNNGFPWPRTLMKKDMQWFKTITTSTNKLLKSVVIMGSGTFESMSKRELQNRYNIIITSKPELYPGVITVKSIDAALSHCNFFMDVDQIFVIGGAQLYKSAIVDPRCDKIYLTIINREFESDTFFPNIPKNYREIVCTNLDTDINVYTYQNLFDPYSSEQQYLDCLKSILEYGTEKIDRTQVGTISKFDINLNFEIKCIGDEYQIPLYTTKFVSFKSIVVELLWFLKGITNVKWLNDRGVRIWNGHSSAEYLATRNLPYDAGIIGPGYGHQWVNWGGTYNLDGMPTFDGINQVQQVIDILKADPNSRRAVISAYNVADLDKMALPPCHLMYMFNVTNGRLNCKVVIRSNDMFLGNPFNTASTTILTVLIAQAIGVIPGNIAISICDAHIYNNHIEQVKLQLTRTPYYFPTMKINKSVNSWQDMAELEYKDFRLNNYNKWPKINGSMAI